MSAWPSGGGTTPSGRPTDRWRSDARVRTRLLPLDPSSPMRVGHGYDSHRFDSGRPLVLGGVRVPDHPGLEGHSDGDAVCHAVTDALLGAAGKGSIGSHFPPSDRRWQDADSVDLLRRVVELLERDNVQVVNVDVTVICESPTIGPLADAMRARLGEVLRIGPSFVGIKGKSNEGMGWIGTGEGLAVHAVALVDRMPDHLTP